MGSREDKDTGDTTPAGGADQSGQGQHPSDKGQNQSDKSPAGGEPPCELPAAVETVVLKPNDENALEPEKETSPDDQGPAKSDVEEGDSESESSDIFLKGLRGLQSDDSFHGMLPDEDIDKLLQYQGDYILHTVEKDSSKGRVIGMSILWNKERVFIQVRAGEPGVTFDKINYKGTILEAAKFHLIEGVPIAKSKTGEPMIIRRPVLREEWELRHDDVELLQKLGEGAFGEVRLGKLKQRNKGTINVAVKVIKGSVTKKAIEEAMKEARMMRRYNHPNVVRFYGVQAEVEPLMILMEYVKGGSLDSYLKKNTETVSVNQRASMCYDAACGLEYLHSHDCIHRDIAARNCLMDVTSRHLKISDFGLSSIGSVQVLDPSKPAPIRWLSPEVIQTGCFQKPADVWSFGVLCWEIYMDAEVPYKEYTMGEVQKRIMDESFRLRLPLTCQIDLRKLIVLCWTGDPVKRPTMAECVKTLKPLFDDKKKSISDSGAKKARKHRKHSKKKRDKHREKPSRGDDGGKRGQYKHGRSRIAPGQSQLSQGRKKGNTEDGSKSRERIKKTKGSGKNLPNTGKHRLKSRKNGSDSDTEKKGKKGIRVEGDRKHRSNKSISPPNSKAVKKRPNGKNKDRKKPSRNEGSDEDGKHKRGGSDEERKHKKGGSDEDRKKESEAKKKSKNRRKKD